MSVHPLHSVRVRVSSVATRIGVHFAYTVVFAVIGVVKLNGLLNVVLSVYHPLNVYPVFVGSVGLVALVL